MVSGAMKPAAKKKTKTVEPEAPGHAAASSETQVPVEVSNVPLYVGTSGWSYTIWKPEFYPTEVASKNFLKFYATRLPAVEVNYTFRSQLSEKAASGWVADVGPNFRFALKANQYITHMRRLKNVEQALQRFLPTLQPLGNHLGPVLFQLPPNLKADVELLREFLTLLPRNFKAALEFRHESWLTGEVFQTLHDHNAALCIAETEKLKTPEVHTAKYTYYRFRQPAYCHDDLVKLAERIERCLAAGLETYAFFKHEEDPRSPLNAVRVLETARTQVSAATL